MKSSVHIIGRIFVLTFTLAFFHGFSIAQVECFLLSNTITLDDANPTFDLDIRGDGDEDFTFTFAGNPDPQPYFTFSIEPIGSINEISMCSEFGEDFVCNIPDCDDVTSQGPFVNQSGIIIQEIPFGGFGNFGSGSAEYIGFTDNGDQGWIAITLNEYDNLSINFTLQAYGIAAPGHPDPVLANKCSNAMPVELMAFDVIEEESGVKLIWEVGQEINLEGYEIQSGENAEDFVTIGFVPAQDHQHYQFLSAFSIYSFQYYRLKMLDLDGSFVYSPIKSIENTESTVGLVSTLVREALIFTESTENPYRIINLHGEIMQSIGRNTTIWNVQSLAAGMYFLQSKNGSVKFLKL